LSNFQQLPSSEDIQYDEFRLGDELGRLVLVTPKDYVAEKTLGTVSGPVVTADVVILDGPDPRELSSVYVFGKILTARLKAAMGGPAVLGRVGKGPQPPKGSPPWALLPFNAEDAATAERYLSGGIAALRQGVTPAAAPVAPVAQAAPAQPAAPPAAPGMAGISPEMMAQMMTLLQAQQQQ
jgi:hypothetical protein